MPNPNIVSIRASTDSLFEVARFNPLFSKVITSRGKNGATMEGVFVPYTYAIRGFKEMTEFKKPYLGLRRIKDSQLVVARHIIELALEEPYDEEEQISPYATEQFIVDGERLFTTPALPSTPGLTGRVRDISKPLEPSKALKLASENYIGLVAQKMSTVSEAASSAIDISMLVI